ncbi:hypothetical protein [Massilia glaciei]|uniref:Uncharacterized protein n=1 Tax=Massilia glaciei TaxID=1524097 RepID=A0A2U2HKE8_9BURK|nr:hypothetical protein [Massilia glaciei]PWF47981.1 hypothetical protein C7C56_012905 [Massilia glaciei]
MQTNTELLQAIMRELAAPGAGPSAAAAGAGLCGRVGHKFGPLVGPATLALLFGRSLETHRARFPWLPRSAEPAALERSFGAREAHEVAAATGAVLDTFITQMATQIGTRLTHQFLRSVFPAATPAPPQENPE